MKSSQTFAALLREVKVGSEVRKEGLDEKPGKKGGSVRWERKPGRKGVKGSWLEGSVR
jgi:hypothetical protein